MALTAKPRQGVAHKKIHANHHHHSRHYLKTYWPYLPLLVIVGFGLYLASAWHYHPSASTQSLVAFNYYNILETSIGVAALAIFLLRHAFAWHKVIVRGEDFATKHPMLDIGLVSLAVVGLLLSHHNIPA